MWMTRNMHMYGTTDCVTLTQNTDGTFQLDKVRPEYGLENLEISFLTRRMSLRGIWDLH